MALSLRDATESLDHIHMAATLPSPSTKTEQGASVQRGPWPLPSSLLPYTLVSLTFTH